MCSTVLVQKEICYVIQERFTPLTVAVREDHIDMAEFLLKESACVDSVDQDQRLVLNNK